MMTYTLNNGDKSGKGEVEIIDQDRLCYLVRNCVNGAIGYRTISKKLLDEFVEYISKHPDAKAFEAREALCGNTEIDKFEYGYCATLVTMAKMVLSKEKDNTTIDPSETETFRQEFIQFWMAIDQHGAEYEKYVSNFETALNPFLPTKNVFAITDIHSYRTIIAEITANHPDLAYLNEENKSAPGGPKTQINSTHNHYIEFLTVLDLLNKHDSLTGKATSSSCKLSIPLQQIFFGAPGTGKSHSIEKRTKDHTEHVVRTTFHPDTD